ncbi:unnamed protein product [Phytophthora lilii]|uniref:Unnamed protein product n=1 Tax=Phytophthora lilii TaxID=2077276 RepID=A0A9W6WT78_9STRA|nr:unnamed protein product [Phytophthora lilii]
MVNARRDQATWRVEWRNKAPRADFMRPTNNTLATAGAVMLDPSFGRMDKKLAAMRGVPQSVSDKLIFSVWIPARDLTAAFSEMEIMTSLISKLQPASCSNNVLQDYSKCGYQLCLPESGCLLQAGRTPGDDL